MTFLEEDETLLQFPRHLLDVIDDAINHEEGNETVFLFRRCPSIKQQIDNSETCLYRHYNKKGELLYVGISLNVLMRLGSHKKKSPWFSDVTDIKLEHFPDRATALEKEKEAIKNEKPKYNIVYVDKGEQ